MQSRRTFAEFFTTTNAILATYGRDPCGAPELLAVWEEGLTAEQAADLCMAVDLLAGTQPVQH